MPATSPSKAVSPAVTSGTNVTFLLGEGLAKKAVRCQRTRTQGKGVLVLVAVPEVLLGPESVLPCLGLCPQSRHPGQAPLLLSTSHTEREEVMCPPIGVDDGGMRLESRGHRGPVTYYPLGRRPGCPRRAHPSGHRGPQGP